MSLHLAELFVELSDGYTVQSAICEKIANALVDEESLSHPTNAHMSKELEAISSAATAARKLESDENAEIKAAAAARKLEEEPDSELADDSPDITEDEYIERKAAEKKKAAAAKRRANAKAKKEKAAVAAEDVDVTELLTKAQELTRKHIEDFGVVETRTVLKSFGVTKCSEAVGDAELLKEIINGLKESFNAQDLI